MSDDSVSLIAVLILLGVVVALIRYLYPAKCPICGGRDGIKLDIAICSHCGHEWER